ncbi:MAG: hypothetical protein H6Q00_3235 [Holophagaceae bacterium]|nr:hypothetical protein [Holophagaceae bacterium]
MSPLKAFRALHTWTGALSGLLLFVVFCAGTLTLFPGELDRLAGTRVQPTRMESPEAFAREIHRRHPELRGAFSLALPTLEAPGLSAYWQAPGGEWVFTTPEDLAAGRPATPRHSPSEFVNEIHHSLGLGQVGSTLLTMVSLVYALALLSGLVLQGARGLRRLLQVKRGAGPRRFWGDLHGALGLASLPFHLVFSLTGALFGGFMLLVSTYDRPVFRGELAPRLERLVGSALPALPVGSGGTPLPLATLLDRARAAVPGFEPAYLRFQAYGTPAAVQILGHREGFLGRFGQLALTSDTGRLLDLQVPGHRDPNHALLSGLYGLHFGDYGGLPVRLAYGLLGLSGTLLLLSGQLIWVEARARTSPRQARLMARLTVGTCGGTLLGLALVPWIGRFAPDRLSLGFGLTLALSLVAALGLDLGRVLRGLGLALTAILLALALRSWPADFGAPQTVALILALLGLVGALQVSRLRAIWR